MIQQFKSDYIKISFQNSEPFNHVIIDNFFTNEFAHLIAEEFPNIETNDGVYYNNPIEIKKAIGDWNKFKKYTYSAFQYMCSQKFISEVEQCTGINGLIADYGLHGGGYHMHPRGGKLNIHKDYSIHPKLRLERRLNIIIYMTPNWNPEWGGGLQLWSHDEAKNLPKECIKVVDNVFNRAVIFDTTQNSWHGLPVEIQCPENITRNSLAIYYLSEPRNNIETHNRALFAPYGEQVSDDTVLELIERRSKVI